MNIAGCTAVLVGVLALAGAGVSATQTASMSAGADHAQAIIEGVWRGHSVCEDKSSPCHDETNVYRFSVVAGKPGVFLVTASKVVNGKEIVMGRGEWKYDAGARAVESEQPRIRLTMDGSKMEGALRLADGTIYRRIYLEKKD